jgi:5'-nucleotidase
MANLLDSSTKKPYAGCKATHIMMHQGVKIGFVGLAEPDWAANLSAVDPKDIIYVDYIEEGRRLAMQLRDEEKCNLIVAVTHFREAHDRRLASLVPEFHLVSLSLISRLSLTLTASSAQVLGGHDHHYVCDHVEPHGVLMVKTGQDFRWLTRVDVTMSPEGGRPTATWERLTMDSSVPEEPAMKALVDSYVGKMAEKMDEVIGRSLVDLDGRRVTIRAMESNLGSFFCDIVRKNTPNIDCVILNAGGFRSDTIHPAGDFKLGDLMTILPYVCNVMVIEATGAQIIKGLENGVSQLPKQTGR